MTVGYMLESHSYQITLNLSQSFHPEGQKTVGLSLPLGQMTPVQLWLSFWTNTKQRVCHLIVA